MPWCKAAATLRWGSGRFGGEKVKDGTSNHKRILFLLLFRNDRDMCSFLSRFSAKLCSHFHNRTPTLKEFYLVFWNPPSSPCFFIFKVYRKQLSCNILGGLILGKPLVCECCHLTGRKLFKENRFPLNSKSWGASAPRYSFLFFHEQGFFGWSTFCTSQVCPIFLSTHFRDISLFIKKPFKNL